jgi:hypothetical protein
MAMEKNGNDEPTLNQDFDKATQYLKSFGNACGKIAYFGFVKKENCKQVGMAQQKVESLQEAAQNLSPELKQEGKAFVDSLKETNDFKEFRLPTKICTFNFQTNQEVCHAEPISERTFIKSAAFGTSVVSKQLHTCLEKPANTTDACLAQSVYIGKLIQKELKNRQ